MTDTETVTDIENIADALYDIVDSLDAQGDSGGWWLQPLIGPTAVQVAGQWHATVPGTFTHDTTLDTFRFYDPDQRAWIAGPARSIDAVKTDDPPPPVRGKCGVCDCDYLTEYGRAEDLCSECDQAQRSERVRDLT